VNDQIMRYFADFAVPADVVAYVGRPIGHHIGGKTLEAASEQIDVIEPYTQARLTGLASGGRSEVNAAVQEARNALAGPWGEMLPLERQKLILKLAEAVERDKNFLAHLETISVGKSISDARSIDVFGSVANLEYFAGWTSKLDGRTTTAVSLPGNPLVYTVKEPVGVVAAIVPWNYPLQTLVWKLAAALACGCTVVCKPSELTPLSAMRLAALAQEVGFPDGVFNVVNGYGHTVGQELAAHPGVDKLSFTGSTVVGTSVGKTALDTMKRLTLELGGKSPVIVTERADLDKAARAIIAGIFSNSGQVCDAGSRVYAQKDVYAKLLGKLRSIAEDLVIGPGLDPAAQITPLVSAAHRSRVLDHIASAHSEGAVLVTGEAKAEQARADGILRPTIFGDCSEGMRIFREEIFGPVLGVTSFETLDEAVDKANSSVYGLAAAVYSDSVEETVSLSRRLKAGNIYINAHGLLDPTMPFGGMRASGFGKDMGPEQLDSYLSTKSIYVQVDA
jgi:phenylacetaldehyde dehydrogenase